MGEERDSYSWWESAEHLPDPGKRVLGYYEGSEAYIIAFHCPVKGWVSQSDSSIYVTHWLDAPCSLFPFSVKQHPDPLPYTYKTPHIPFGTKPVQNNYPFLSKPIPEDEDEDDDDDEEHGE